MSAHALVSTLMLLAALSARAGAPLDHSSSSSVSSGDYSSIQEAVDKNPGTMIYVPAGFHDLTKAIRITGDHGGLFGPGCLRMSDPDQPILVLQKANGTRISDLTLTRPAGKMDTVRPGVFVEESADVTLEGLRVLDNRSTAGSIRLEKCTNAQVLNCQVINYMTIAVDDRTANPLYGFSFRCTDGTGISVQASRGTLLQGNSVIERVLRPTPEIKAAHQLGSFVKRAPQRGILISEEVWTGGTFGAWQQGAGIFVTSPADSDSTRLIGNLIENPAQGIDIHADHVIIANNIINNAFFGMKACHGSRNVIITGNQIARASLIGIALSPAASSSPANPDGGHLVANNIISDFGRGDAWWMWDGSTVLPVGPTPISIGVGGQMPDDPPLRNVLVANNMVYDTEADGTMQDGQLVAGEPRYNFAVYFADEDQPAAQGALRAPRNIRFSANMFDPGRRGISNVPLPE